MILYLPQKKIFHSQILLYFCLSNTITMRNKFILLFLLILGEFQLIFSQPQYTFKRLTMTDGLVSNYIVDVIQDKQGYIWMASESGLCKFDGNDFTIYNTGNSAIKSNAHNVLYYNKADNTVWVGTQRDGVCIFNCETQTFSNLPGMMTQDVTDLSPSSDGGIWITHYHLGIDYYNNKTKKITPYKAENIKGLSSGHFWCAKEDNNGHLYVGLQKGGLAVIDIKKRTAKVYRHNPQNPYSIPNNTVHCILISKTNSIWIGTEDGLALFNPQKEQFISFQNQPNNPTSILSNQINDIGESKDGKLWICTQMGGVSILDLNENVFTSPQDTHFQNIKATNDLHGISSPNAKSFLQDSFGNIWIGNYRGGVDFLSYNKSIFQTLEYNILKDGTLTDKQVWGLTIDNESNVWLGGEHEIAVFNEKMQLQKIISLAGKTNPHTHASVIFKDKNGMLWIGLYKDGILMCNPKNETITRVPINDKDAEICCIYEDYDKIWIGTQNGLFSWKDGIIVEEKIINEQLPDLMIHGIQRDRQGRLWLGTFGKGLVVFSAQKQRIMQFDTTNGMNTNAVNSLYLDKKGGLWAATRAGIAYIANPSKPQIEIFNHKQGLINENVRAIIEDKQGKIWLSTNGGIAQWKEKEKKFLNYTWHQGVPRGDFMDGSVCIKKDGTLFWGSQNGACYFNPKDIVENTPIAPVQITSVRSYYSQPSNKASISTITNGKVHLSYKNNTFTVTFGVMDYTQSPQVEYAYTMEGLGKTWFEVENENKITFRDLQPGEYTFKVKARMRNQAWNDNFTAIQIIIAPPVWLTWYAKLTYIIIICFIMYAILHFYKRKLALESRLNLEHHQHENDQKLNNERLRFYTNITHELRTPLTLILGPLEDLQADKTLSPRQTNKISIIRNSANRLLNLINQILEFRKTETENRRLKVCYDDLTRLIQEIGIKYKELNQNPNVKIHIKTDLPKTKLYYDQEIITIIVDNLMSNALKYTAEGGVTLSIKTNEEANIKYTTISVEDTGHGISKESLNHIFERYYQGQGKYQVSGSGIGLALVKSLADLHQATIDVESEVEKGSKFTLKLLTENTYPNAEHQTIKETDSLLQENVLSSNEPTETEDGKPLILIVEDNQDIREYIRSSFEDRYEVITAVNGKEGWEIAQNQIPNIIISDIMMPIMDGIELCRHIKEDMRTSHIPIILLTAKDTLQDKEEGYAAGADSFITKPFSARLLNSRINNILENRRKIAGVITAIPETENEQKNIENERKNLNKLDQEFLNKVTNIIEENLSFEKIDVAFIADKMCMSHSTLYRKIKGLTEMSVNEFVRKIKMKKSIELINCGNYTLTEISDLTGFSSIAYFRQCFKDEYGMAPTEYLKKKQK